MNKKAISAILGVVLMFMIGFTLMFFISVFLHDIGRTEVLDNIDTFVTNVEDNVGLSNQIKNEIHSLPDEYSALIIPYDLFFVMTFLVFFSSSLYASYKTNEEGWLSFMGSVTIVIIVFLFISTFVTGIVDWLLEELILNFVGFDLNNTPIIEFYFDNLGLINFIWALLIILVNKLNFTLKREGDDLNTYDPIIEEGVIER